MTEPGPPPLRAGELLAACAVALALVLPGLWAFTLIDPWEGHYAEVGRRILADADWIHLHWRDEVFRSKPALAPWLIAASLRAHGLAAGGGFGGELVSSPLALFAVRLPFALFATMGAVAVWTALARLAIRRAAWFALAVVSGVPLYGLVARQAMTDMPMAAATAGALSLFALAAVDGDAPLRRIVWRLTAHHLALAALALVVAPQLMYGAAYLAARPGAGRALGVAHPVLWMVLPLAGGLAAFFVITTWVWPARARRDVLLFGAYALVGVGVLAKGPPGAALVVSVVAIYVAVTAQWRLLLRLRILEGTFIALLIAAPWHLAMALTDGPQFLVRYFGHHWIDRAAGGAHMVNRAGEGTLSYFVQQLGVGLWPVVAAVPVSVVAAARVRLTTPSDHLRLLALLWSLGGVVLFTSVETKFHHYVLPAVPGVAVLVALWLDEAAAGRAPRDAVLLALGVAAAALVTWDIASQQERILELFCYRYDRSWPSKEPWRVDLSGEIILLGACSSAAAAAMLFLRARRVAVWMIVASSVALGLWAGCRYMVAAAPHWGQGQLHATYYRLREVQGVRLHYRSERDLALDWPASGRTIAVDTYVPDALEIGAPMTVTVEAGGARADLGGRVSRLGDRRVFIEVGAAEIARLPVALSQGDRPRGPGPAWTEVVADRLITWNLFWRSEIFWSSGELWGRTADTRSDFGYRGEGLRPYLEREEARGRRFFALTEAGRVESLRRSLPTAKARESLEVVDRSSNKYTLLRFEL